LKLKNLLWLLKNLQCSKISFKTYIKHPKNTGNGTIILHNNVVLNPYVFLQANKGFIEIGENSEINNFTIINAGAKITIGKNVLIGPKVNIISYTHNYEDANTLIKKAKYSYKRNYY